MNTRITLGIISALFLLLSFNKVLAQNSPVDSLRAAYSSAQSDSARVVVLLDLGYLYESENADSALHIYQRAEVLSAKSGFALGQAKALQYQGIVYNNLGQYFSSILSYNKALEWYKNADSENGIATTYNNLGNVYLYLGDFKEAIRFYLLAQPVFEKMKRDDQLVVLHGNQGDCYRQLKDYPAMLTAARHSYHYANKLQDPIEIANAGITLGTALSLNQNSDSSVFYLNESLKIGRSLQDASIMYYAMMDLANEDLKKGNKKEAVIKADSVMLFAEQLQKNYLLIAAHNLRGDCFDALGKGKDALKSYQTALQMAKSDGSLKLVQESLDRLYNWHFTKKKFAEALRFRNEWIAVNDSLFNAEKSKQIALFRTVFETEQKEKIIAEEKAKGLEKDAEIKKRNLYLIIAALVIILLGVSAVLLIKFQRNKRILAEQISLLEKEKNKALQNEQDAIQMRALVQGQEQERQRLGRELHDGLGGMLSAAKLQLEQIGKDAGAAMPVDKYLGLQNLITRTTREMRAMSHNLAPEGLDKLGLSESVKSYCSRLDVPGLTIIFESFGEAWSKGAAEDAAIFRMIQELLNNTIKHAEAKECFVSLSYLPDSLNITVEDNGKGFDSNQTNYSGNGMNSLKARMAYLKGKVEIISGKGKGTSVNMSIPHHG
jgi:signal transduction histidine kinase/Tfp pilus assembly protein PilF